jgi:hypothetical protein
VKAAIRDSIAAEMEMVREKEREEALKIQNGFFE